MSDDPHLPEPAHIPHLPVMNRIHAHASLFLFALLFGCVDGRGEGHPADAPLLVMAATSLNGVAPHLADAFEARTGTPVEFVLGSTGNLAAQIQNGAPADVFLSADTETVDRLARDGRLRPASVRTYAVGELVLIWRDGIDPPTGLTSLLEPRFEAVAIANPEHAPYGVTAREALRRSGIGERLDSRLVLAESVSQTYQLVRTGNADAGLVARSVLLDAPDLAFIPLSRDLYSPIAQSAGVVATTRNPAAERFLDFLVSPDGRTILASRGFAAP